MRNTTEVIWPIVKHVRILKIPSGRFSAQTKGRITSIQSKTAALIPIYSHLLNERPPYEQNNWNSYRRRGQSRA